VRQFTVWLAKSALFISDSYFKHLLALRFARRLLDIDMRPTNRQKNDPPQCTIDAPLWRTPPTVDSLIAVSQQARKRPFSFHPCRGPQHRQPAVGLITLS
jgi:hypothetical protein